MTSASRFVVEPGGALTGEVVVPGDKSVSHRAAILGGIAAGETQVSGFLEGLDTLCTLRAMVSLGAGVDGPHQGRVLINGVGASGLRAASGPVDLGNSGTAMRLLPGVLAGQTFATTLTGDASLSGRPMRRIADPLAQMGARIQTTSAGTPPLSVGGGTLPLSALDYQMPVASAQVKSCLLLATLYARGETRVVEPAPTRDHTERMLRGFGAEVESSGGEVRMAGEQQLRGTRVVVPGDLSSAAFFLVGASIAPGSDLLMRGVGMNPTRFGVIEILRQMGADITVMAEREEAGEPLADLRVRSARLRGVEIDPGLVPLAIDEFPALFVAAACAEGETRLSGAAELRVKESDRIGVMADGLTALGVDAKALADGMIIRGGPISGGQVDSHGDHRIAMSFAMAGLRATGPIEIADCANVETSFPGFADIAVAAGLRLISAPAA